MEFLVLKATEKNVSDIIRETEGINENSFSVSAMQENCAVHLAQSSASAQVKILKQALYCAGYRYKH